MFNKLVLKFTILFASILSLGSVFNLCFLDIVKSDSPEPWAIGFQDGASPGYTGIVELHDNIFFYLVVIAILVFWMLGSTIYYFNYDKTKITHKYLVHGTLIEILWTIFPAIVLLAIAIPSFRLLYILDEVTLPTITVKVTGHQWYWSYEYSDYETESGDPIEFDSYMVPDSDLEIGQTRLLEVDNPIILPENTHVRFIVTSTDVLHDFAVPAAGIKIDAAPGRLNQTSGYFEREGEFFGQCSELCGTYHGFMPIQIEVGTVEEYLSWISSLIPVGFLIRSNKKNSNPLIDGFLMTFVNLKSFHSSLEKESIVDSNKEKVISKEIIELEEGLIEFKNDVKNIQKEDINNEWKDIDYKELNLNYEEAFLHLLKNHPEIEEITNNSSEKVNVVEILEVLKIQLEKCKSNGITKDCLEQIKISEILKATMSETEGGGILLNKIEHLVKEQIKNIREIPLGEIEEKIETNVEEMGYSFISYGIILNSYNKFVHNRPFPVGVSTADLATIRLVRDWGRVLFAGIVAPMMLYDSFFLRRKGVEMGGLFFFTKLKTKVGVMIFVLLLVIIFNYIGGWYYLNNEIISPYLEYLFLISVFIPIIINVVFLLFFNLIERKRVTLVYLNKICENKELLNYYRKRNKAEICFYFFILLVYFVSGHFFSG